MPAEDNGPPSWILEFVVHEFWKLEWQPPTSDNSSLIQVQKLPSAQQRVWIIRRQSPHCTTASVVVRQWLSGRGWWNLNAAHSNGENRIQAAARSEITGYRLARKILTPQHLTIPQVLHFCCEQQCWALLEYVEQPVAPVNSGVGGGGMEIVKVRQEFGFEEPHPRWGRLLVEQSPAYARKVLEQLVLPLHRGMQAAAAAAAAAAVEDDAYYLQNLQGLAMPEEGRGYRYFDMVALYRTTYSTILEPSSFPPRFRQAVLLLGKAINRLEEEAVECGLMSAAATTTDHTILPRCVLCHMDLQPQNIIFDDHQDILAVVDWEEAAYADPRFELLLLCRKVLANRQQADDLWRLYQELTLIDLGPIDPWLKLETVHSLTTLLLQACGGGGRSPWEQEGDLWGKIERAFKRLVLAGWTFCTLDTGGH